MKRCYIAQAEDKDATDVYRKMAEQLTENGETISPQFIVFSSDNYNFGYYSRMLSNSFPDATILGATSAVIYSKCGVSNTGLSVMAITSGLKLSTGAVFEIGRYPKRSAGSITGALSQVDPENTVCLEFNASPEYCEELVMDTFRMAMGQSTIPVFGCSGAAAFNPDRPASVSLNGIVYNDACVFAFIHNENGRVGLVRENMFRPTKHFFTATDVDCDERKVYEFDHRTATSAVARALEIPEDELSSNAFFHPLGSPRGDDFDVIGINDQFKDGSMSFFARIYNQTRVVLLEPKEPLEQVWTDTSKKVHELIPKPSFSIVINCYQRTSYFTSIERFVDYNCSLADEYGDYIGFSGFGEQYEYKHANQVMLIAAFE